MGTKWSETVADYYPINPRPRYGHGLPEHAVIAARLESQLDRFSAALGEIEAARDVLHSIPNGADPAQPTLPHWHNIWFSTLDAAALVGFLLARRPKRYLEIGSGFSTKFTAFAKRAGGLATTITSIDPRPRAEIDALCDRLIRQPLEDSDMSCFDELEAGDILFYDGSHRVFTNSDVTVFFLEVLPRLKPGVLVHIYDIFLPSDYPPGWNNRLYSEQYMLAPSLMANQDIFETTLPNFFASNHPVLGPRIRALFAAAPPSKPIPFVYPNGTNCPGVSFWLTRGAAKAASMPTRTSASLQQAAAAPPPAPRPAPAPAPRPPAPPGMQSLDFIARRIRDFSPGIVFDIGANKGQSTQQFRQAWPDARILAFEPVPSSLAALRENVGDAKGVEILPMALGRREGIMRMQARETNPMNRLVRDGEPLGNTVEVQVTTGDAFCRVRGIETIDFLKIDTEGSDLDVLLGFSDMLARRAVTIIQVEAGMSPDNERHVPLTRFMPFLGDHGYLLLHLFDEVRRNHRLPPARQQLRGMWFCNAVFVAENPDTLLMAPSGMNR